MKKLLCIAAAVMMCMTLISCGEETPDEIERAGIPETTAAYINSFNDCAKDTDYALGIYNGNDEGTLSVATTDEYSVVKCAEDNGMLSWIDVEGAGIFQPGIAAYDYMVYSLIACDKKLDYKAAGDMIASMYYEANTGGEAVEMAYDDIRISFTKAPDYCELLLERRAAE